MMRTVVGIFRIANRYLVVAFTLLVLVLAPGRSMGGTAVEVIVQASDVETATALVRRVGGQVTHELGIINAVGATLSLLQISRLQARSGVRVYGNRQLELASDGWSNETVRDEFSEVYFGNNDGTADCNAFENIPGPGCKNRLLFPGSAGIQPHRGRSPPGTKKHRAPAQPCKRLEGRLPVSIAGPSHVRQEHGAFHDRSVAQGSGRYALLPP